MLRSVRHPVARCCAMLGVVGSNLKMVKLFIEQVWMLHDVAVVSPGSCHNFPLGHAHRFDFQYPTCRNTSQQGGQTHATCCTQQCYDMLRWHVAIVWLGLK